jgi:hypothetical protein
MAVGQSQNPNPNTVGNGTTDHLGNTLVSGGLGNSFIRTHAHKKARTDQAAQKKLADDVTQAAADGAARQEANKRNLADAAKSSKQGADGGSTGLGAGGNHTGPGQKGGPNAGSKGDGPSGGTSGGPGSGPDGSGPGAGGPGGGTF